MEKTKFDVERLAKLANSCEENNNEELAHFVYVADLLELNKFVLLSNQNTQWFHRAKARIDIQLAIISNDRARTMEKLTQKIINLTYILMISTVILIITTITDCSSHHVESKKSNDNPVTEHVK